MNKLVIGIIILLTFIVPVTVKAQYVNELKLKVSKTDSLTLKKNTVDLPKEPALAGILSSIVPGFGLGQLYNGQTGKFIRHVGISAGIFAFTILAFGTDWVGISPGGGSKNLEILYVAAGLYIGNWIWSIADAVISANNINRKAEMKKSRSDVMDKLKFGISVNKNKQLNLKFAFDL